MMSVLFTLTQNEKEVLFHLELLEKFDINGQRYTSHLSADRHLRKSQTKGAYSKIL
jgi:oxygen-independent coproporphyrinogen-3 oxidase